MNQRIVFCLLSFILYGCSFEAIAAKEGASSDWYTGLDFGLAFSRHQDTINIENLSQAESPYNIDLYSTNHHHNQIVGVQAGKRFSLNQSIVPLISLGLRYQYYVPNDLKGEVTLYSDQNYKNYQYEWSTSAHIFFNKYQIKPWKNSKADALFICWVRRFIKPSRKISGTCVCQYHPTFESRLSILS